MAVMGFDDFDINIITKSARGEFQKFQADIHANAHIGRPDDRCPFRELSHTLFLTLIESCCPEDSPQPVISAESKAR